MASSTLGGGDAGGIAMGSASLTMGDGKGVMILARGAGCSVMEMTGRSTLDVTGEQDAVSGKGGEKKEEKLKRTQTQHLSLEHNSTVLSSTTYKTHDEAQSS